MKRTRSYDAIERLKTETDPRTGATTYAYYTEGQGSLGKLESVTNAAGNVTRFEYDQETGWRVRTIRDPDGKNLVNHVKYDEHGRVLATWGDTTSVRLLRSKEFVYV